MTLKTEPRLSCRPASGEQDALAIGRLLVEMGREVGRAEMDEADFTAAFAEVVRVINDEAAYVIEDADGLAVASLGLIEGQHWYSPRLSYLSERWFYVLPALRGGPAREMLEAEAKALADLSGLPVYLKYFDPAKMAEAGRKVYVGAEIGYIPMGRIARVNPCGVPVIGEG